MTRVLTGNVAGARFRFSADQDELVSYARLHLARVIDSLPGDVDVDVVLRWHEGLPSVRAAASDLAAMDRVDRDLYVGPGRLCWFRVDDLRDLWLRFSWNGQRLEVEGDFFFRVGATARADQLRRLVLPGRTADMRRRRFTTLLSYLVYYPCWWWLEHRRGQHPIHAAAVNTERGGILLAGGSGIGKSTVSVLLGAQPGAQFLADSFVLHRGLELLPVREPILIDRDSQHWLGPALAALAPIPWSYMLGRNGFHFAPDRLANASVAALLLFPRRAAKPYLRPISSDTACAWLSAGDLIINDLRRYWAFAAVLEYLAADNLMARREANLRALATQIPCYELGLSREQESGELATSLLRLQERPA